MRPRAASAAALMLACSAAAAQHADAVQAPRSPAAVTDARADDPAVATERAALLGRAESALARGDTPGALDAFDRAAMMLHAPDTEMGLVRTYMQSGQYRRALAFCAHTADSHLEAPAAGALYAWLLRAGGQPAVAERVLDQTLSRSPTDPVSLKVRDEFKAPLPAASGLLLQAPHRMAPQTVKGSGVEVPEAAQVVSSGVLVANGTLALVPTASLAQARPKMLWVRNGLGQASEAWVDDSVGRRLDGPGVTVLRLATPLESDGTPAAASRDPFAGSPGFVLDYAAAQRATPAWPWLNQGFLGSNQGGTGLRRLGIGVPDGPHGGPVLDANGDLVGIALRGDAQDAVMLPASRWMRATIEAVQTPASVAVRAQAPRRAAPMAADEVYERGLRVALQLIVLR
jgi:hypothetical protein